MMERLLGPSITSISHVNFPSTFDIKVEQITSDHCYSQLPPDDKAALHDHLSQCQPKMFLTRLEGEETKVKEEEIVCEHCQLPVDGHQCLQAHLMKCHPGVSERTQNLLEDSLKEEGVVCEHCQLSVEDHQSLQAHLLKCHPGVSERAHNLQEENLECPEEGCLFETTILDAMKNHLLEQHELDMVPLEDEMDSNEDGDALHCKQCSYQCANQDLLDKHTQTHHGNMSRSGRYGDALHCKQCSYQCANQDLLDKHTQTHHGNMSRSGRLLADSDAHPTCHPGDVDGEAEDVVTHRDDNDDVAAENGPKISVQGRRGKKNVCPYCGIPQTKFSRHIFCRHDDEFEVQRAAAFSAGSKERQEIVDKLICKGNFMHNAEVIRRGEGTLVPPRARAPIAGEASPQLILLMARMKDDAVTAACRQDPLILQFGARLLKLALKPHLYPLVRLKIRELGRLLVELTKDSREESLQAFIHPSRFLTVVAAVNRLTAAKDGKRAKTYLALNLGCSLADCARILATRAIIDGESGLKTAADDFFLLCKRDWKLRVSCRALVTSSGPSHTAGSASSVDPSRPAGSHSPAGPSHLAGSYSSAGPSHPAGSDSPADPSHPAGSD